VSRSAYDIAREYQETAGWGDWMLVDALTDYIENQGNNQTLVDFLEMRLLEEAEVKDA
jgi:hypothetical protein